MSATEVAMTVPIAGPRRRHGTGQGEATMRSDRAAPRYNRIQVALGVLAMAAAAALVIIGALNRSLQADVAAGQVRVANAQAAANVNNTLIRLLAKAAAEKNDEKIRTLLSQNGISFQQTLPDGTANAGAPVQPQ